MTAPYPGDPTTSQRAFDPSQATVGELIGQVTNDVTTLMRQEFALAKAEMKVEAKKAGKAGGFLGGAGFAGYMLALFASVAVMAALDEALPLWLAAAVVAVLYGIAALLLYVRGHDELTQVDPVPHRTVETLQEGMPR